MAEQGFAMQHHALVDSALVSEPGLHVGASLATFPFGPPESNLSGKQENTSFSPVFPRLQVAWVGEDWSVGVAGLPPIPVGGASAASVALSGTVTRPWRELTAGLEGDLTWVRARAPVTASPEQIEGASQLDNPDNVNSAVAEQACGADGCIDTFQMVSPAIRLAIAAPRDRWTPFGKLGLTYANQQLHVEYDDTTWHLQVPQPTAHVGTAAALGSRWTLVAGASAALKTAATQRGTGGPVLWKLEGAASVRF